MALNPITVELPCQIGDSAWAIKSYNTYRRVEKGAVSEMFFNSKMELVIVVSRVSRGLWGKAVFPTQEEAEKALEAGSVTTISRIPPVKETLCWRCAKSGGLCTWSHSGEPVEGWRAAETTRKNYQGDLDTSYTVIECPEFEEG